MSGMVKCISHRRVFPADFGEPSLQTCRSCFLPLPARQFYRHRKKRFDFPTPLPQLLFHCPSDPPLVSSGWDADIWSMSPESGHRFRGKDMRTDEDPRRMSESDRFRRALAELMEAPHRSSRPSLGLENQANAPAAMVSMIASAAISPAGRAVAMRRATSAKPSFCQARSLLSPISASIWRARFPARMYCS